MRRQGDKGLKRDRNIDGKKKERKERRRHRKKKGGRNIKEKKKERGGHIEGKKSGMI